MAATASLGSLKKEGAYKALVILRKAFNVLKDSELLAYESFEEEFEITETTLITSHQQLEKSMVQ